MSRTLEDTYYVIQYKNGNLAHGYKARATPKLYKKKGQAISLAGPNERVLGVKLVIVSDEKDVEPTPEDVKSGPT